MDVVSVLVEKLGVDVNAQSQDKIPRYSFEKPVPGGVSALHALALGRHWWHAAQAIPYLVAHAGADTELRNPRGQTPLHIALDSPGVFWKQAAQVLVLLGADVNAVDGQGRGSLARAGKDADLLRLLLARGAKLSASALFGAIDGHNVESLKALLSAGIDANMRLDTADEKVLQERGQKLANDLFHGELDMD
jgi:ankyrin repeat protein